MQNFLRNCNSCDRGVDVAVANASNKSFLAKLAVSGVVFAATMISLRWDKIKPYVTEEMQLLTFPVRKILARLSFGIQSSSTYAPAGP